MINLESYLERTSALELASRSLVSAPVYAVISLIILMGTPILTNYGWWAAGEAGLLIGLAIVRVVFSLGFEKRYDRIGERAVVQFNILTALQSLTLGVLAAIAIWQYWATQEVVLTIVLSAGCIAAGTSALSVRRSAHFIFLICVLCPLGIAVFMVGGIAKTLLILGFLVLMAFLVQDGGQARKTFQDHLKSHYEDEVKSRRAILESKAKKKFLLDIGHELRTPINSIFGMTTLLLDEDLNSKQREHAEIIRMSTNSLLNLVNNVPGAVRFRPEDQDLELESVNLQRSVHRVLQMYHTEISRKGLAISSRLEDLPEIVTFSYQSHFEQVLVNLVGNAVKFTDEGSISLLASCQEPGEGSMVINFSITDSGPGIPEARKNDLFDPFGTSEVISGEELETGGLGLPLCKGLVELMGGEIWIDSTQGKGTTVGFAIKVGIEPSISGWEPVKTDELDSYPDFYDALNLEYPHDILVVDDDDIHRKILCTHLTKMGYRPDEATDGQQAIAAVINKHYDLIFMDLHMPNMGGIQANRWIREHFNHEQNLHVVALTGDATSEVREECVEAGMDSFVPKPMQVDDLQTILKKQTGSNC